MEFTVDRQPVEGVEVLGLEGRIDIFTAPILVKALIEVLVPGCAGAVLDIDGVDSLDSTGLGLLVGGLKRARQNGVPLQLVCTHIQILNLFRIVGLAKTFGIHPSVEDAIAAIREEPQS
ncbi:MAG TPA: STAS domain-containing protein [Candidatus Sulfotelmatobacter sp.]|nr:STAS domain-containing protein [Candidatus Sulfotelmatobacter sp.]